MKSRIILMALSLCGGMSPATGGVFPDIGYQPPEGWTGTAFVLSQDYPAPLPPEENVPWKTIDFRTQPKEYLEAVLAYSFEGNIEVEFDVQNNAVRKWYHAPWLHWGPNGREFVHGLTRERSSRPFELAAGQDQTYRNYAVGVYNPRGGHVIGQVWRDPDSPDYTNVVFPEGAATFKLLFTTAPVAKVPFLAGSPEWVADIDRASDPASIEATKVRLLQVDVAVRDSRSSSAGWVFGTFHFDPAIPAMSPWLKLRPLALLWGNDPTLTQSQFEQGQQPVESWVNGDSPIVQYRANPPAGVTPPPVLGWAGRGNGPVDNPVSSCLSCHSTAQIPALSPMIPRANLSEMQKLRWFRNLAVGEAFDSGSNGLDFSLQLAVGIQNFQEFRSLVDRRGGFVTSDLGAPKQFLGPRDEQPKFTSSVPKGEHGMTVPQYRLSRDAD